jgi:hypothetical protein
MASSPCRSCHRYQGKGYRGFRRTRKSEAGFFPCVLITGEFFYEPRVSLNWGGTTDVQTRSSPLGRTCFLFVPVCKPKQNYNQKERENV